MTDTRDRDMSRIMQAVASFSPAAARPALWRGGGGMVCGAVGVVMIDLATHDLDMVRYLTGQEAVQACAEAEQEIHLHLGLSRNFSNACIYSSGWKAKIFERDAGRVALGGP